VCGDVQGFKKVQTRLTALVQKRKAEKELHVSVALAEFQSFLFIAIISGAAGRRRPTF
jgi:hypothetical protein